ncbi:hypothetical protein B7494_g1687 [Chlorociboria aeruginascens]|nr:hypothetical protein B7494_g1687 [Chlorociboria aeruginascens]
MFSAAEADPAYSDVSDQSPSHGHAHTVIHEAGVEANHNLPARTMAEDDRNEKDDPATMAASEELKHTTISDKVLSKPATDTPPPRPAPSDGDKDMGEEAVKEHTPEAEPTDAQDEEMKERLSSPKKKRGRDQDEDIKDLESEKLDGNGDAAGGAAINGSRTMRSGPEKKRHRDTSEDPSKFVEQSAEVQLTAKTDPSERTETSTAETKSPKESASAKPIFGSALRESSPTSNSAFASSGFASLAASSTSPFGAIGASKPSVFGGSTQTTTTGFGGLSGAEASSTISGLGSTTGKKTIGGFGGGFGSAPTSGFGALGKGSVFGSALGNGFGSGATPKLSSFAAPGKENGGLEAKPAKAFGAPDSDDDEGSENDEEDDDERAGTGDEESSIKHVTDEKKKVKTSKVPVEDGEAGEATLLQMRAKLFALTSKETGWKERGVGTLKINVPKPCASFDENGLAIPGSFAASGLEDVDESSTSSRVPRLIMRQENTHRVILNTIIVRAMEFKDKPAQTTAQIIFTAFEGETEPKPISMLLKLSEVNARLFRSEIDSIQHEL